MGELGPATERAVTEAFAGRPLLTAALTADLLGMNVSTLRAMRGAGMIRAVLIGENTYRYTEADVCDECVFV